MESHSQTPRKSKSNGTDSQKKELKGKKKADLDYGQCEGDVNDRLWVDMYEPATEVGSSPRPLSPVMGLTLALNLLAALLIGFGAGRSSSPQKKGRRCPAVVCRSIRRWAEREIEEV